MGGQGPAPTAAGQLDQQHKAGRAQHQRQDVLGQWCVAGLAGRAAQVMANQGGGVAQALSQLADFPGQQFRHAGDAALIADQ